MSNNNFSNDKAIGFFPITGDPIHYGHLNGAMEVLKKFCLDQVFIQVCGNIPSHKPNKASAWHRQQMAKLAIKEFEPQLQYIPLGYDNDLVGEDLFVKFVQMQSTCNISKFYYIAGIDNKDTVIARFAKNKNDIEKSYQLVFLARPGYTTSNFKYPMFSFNTNFSSSAFRNHESNVLIPEIVQLYCNEHHLYGY